MWTTDLRVAARRKPPRSREDGGLRAALVPSSEGILETGGANPTFSTRDANWRFHSKKTQKTRVQSRKETRKADVVKTKWLFNLRSHFRIRRHVLAIRTAD